MSDIDLVKILHQYANEAWPGRRYDVLMEAATRVKNGDEARAATARVEALCEMRDHVSGAPGNGIVATASVMRALRGPETSGAVTGEGNPFGAGINPAAPEPRDRWGRCPNCGAEHTGGDCMEGKQRGEGS